MADTLKVWIVNAYRGSETVNFLQEQLRPFLSAHPSIRIEWRLLTFANALTEFVRAYKQGTPPDVFEFGTTWLPTLARLHMLSAVPHGMMSSRPIAPYLATASRYDERVYGVPWTADTTCFMARKDIIKQFAIDPMRPLSWDQFRHICRKIAENRLYGCQDGRAPRPIHFSCRPERVTLHRMSPWLWSGGFEFPRLHEKPVSIMTSPRLQSTLEYVDELMHISGSTTEEARMSNYEGNLSFFMYGHTAFHMTSLFEAIRNVVSGPDPAVNHIPTQVIAMPCGPSGSIPYGGGSMLGVSSATKNQNAAWELVAALQAPTLVAAWTSWIYSLPAIECDFWERYLQCPDIQVLYANMQRARTYPMHPMWGSLERRLAVGLSELMWHLVEFGKNTETFARAARIDSEINEILSLYWEVEI
ncbi:sugar ABC transporter substrate-binding protein [Alicyclobacillus hesperidum subsp. aegles]|uniref:ABC transporter substrate-binding protein n=1 Tax=Alicyclobacillus hesperidum TaxID=89784 RepID=UPI0007194135|nr:extracellular solute-binding protein [Alicyclobacillus hesperidum]KRW91508.1 hypothetical protein SD51_08445 [Alicyclobacillus tengchongensis]GLG02358.1 sugar ABC transporter substrate-binding protein [Alicyclobacillus hesperidum subsp. aegles]